MWRKFTGSMMRRKYQLRLNSEYPHFLPSSSVGLLLTSVALGGKHGYGYGYGTPAAQTLSGIMNAPRPSRRRSAFASASFVTFPVLSISSSAPILNGVAARSTSFA